MTLTPEALDELVERLRARAPYYEDWARDIREMNGRSVDADHADATARALRAAADAIAALRKERDEARQPAPPGLPTIIPHDERERRIAEEVHATARSLERERCAMLAEMAGQMELAKQIRAEP